MLRILPMGAILVAYLGSSQCLSGQTPDHRLDDAAKEIALLKRMVADQDQRIATLERNVRSLRSSLLAASQQPVRTSWRNIEGWAAIKIGMSRAQVVEILGEPQSTFTVIDRQTLFYKDATNPVGNVVITDDRVSEVDSPRFQVYASSNN
jgi:hypothetical protein